MAREQGTHRCSIKKKKVKSKWLLFVIVRKKRGDIRKNNAEIGIYIRKRTHTQYLSKKKLHDSRINRIESERKKKTTEM